MVKRLFIALVVTFVLVGVVSALLAEPALDVRGRPDCPGKSCSAPGQSDNPPPGQGGTSPGHADTPTDPVTCPNDYYYYPETGECSSGVLDTGPGITDADGLPV